MFTKLLLFLVVASYALYANGRSVPRETPHFNGLKNDGKETSTSQKDDQTSQEPEEDMLVHVARGLLGGLTNKVNEVQKTAQGYKNKAEEKVKEAKKKAEALPGKVMSKLPAGLGKRKLSNLENDKIVPLERSDDGGLDNDMNKATGQEPEEDMLVHVARGLLGGLTNKVNEVQKTAQGYKNKAEEKVKEAKKKAEALPGKVMSKLPGLGKRRLSNLENDKIVLSP
ncbi:hypothetical protein OS493_027668 [Desmophyllum pertusum]|uniref:Uncharacterized protein n=1 Tax=Desmophyllum pertusum TaxID=174260 RepID=A0A9X0D2N7_9CNID|nr:hypothetical protein OS493_027668 [Desmophyllum pertusum]